MTNLTTRLTTAALLACGALLPATASAQRIHVAVEPRVTTLPAASMWNAARSEEIYFQQAALFGTPTGPADGVYTHSVKLSHGTMPLYGGRLTVASPGGAWRMVLDGATGSGTMRAEVYDIIRAYPTTTSTTAPESYGFDNGDLPLTLTQFGVHVERALHGRRHTLEIGGGAMAQRLHTRTQVMYVGPSTGGLPYNEFHYASATDPALQASAAVGPSSGPLAGLRVAFRSTHVWRLGDFANQYGNSNAGLRYRNNYRRWQWQPELSLGWQLPMFGGNPMAR